MVVGAACALLVGCSGDPEPTQSQSGSAQPSATPIPPASSVAFTDCADACEGEIDGAKYKILLPKEWNGTLLLYSHGYRSPVSVPPDYSPVTSKAEPSPGYSDGGVPLARDLLSKGYALAGSGWASNGWAISDGVKANTDLYEFFSDTVGKPERVYAWGDSLGGLVTMETTEANPDWVSGAAPLCGVLGGIVPNFDLAMDVQYGIRELVDPSFQLTGYESSDAASQQFVSTARKVLDAAGSKEDRANILALALLADAKLQTQSQDGSTVDSQVQAAAESALIALRFGTVGRWDVEQRYGGNISDNTKADYAARLSDDDRALLDEVGGAGTAKRIIGALEDGKRVVGRQGRGACRAQGRRGAVGHHRGPDPHAAHCRRPAGGRAEPDAPARGVGPDRGPRPAVHGGPGDVLAQARRPVRRGALPVHAGLPRRDDRPARCMGSRRAAPD